MITIYGVYRSRASRNIWLLNELGVKFKHVPVIQLYRLPNASAEGGPMHTKSPAFLKINPNGHIPTMDDDGLVLHESLAINLYLIRKFGGPLGPNNPAEQGLIYMWTLWAATEVEPHSISLLYGRMGGPTGAKDEALALASIEALRAPFAVLNAALAKSGHPVGGRFTVADIAIAEVVRYAMPAPELFEAAPRVKAWLAACHARPAFKKMWEARDKEPA